MESQFDIIEFLSGMTGFVFDKATLKNIAWKRDVADVTSYAEMDAKTRDLLLADLLFVAYISPEVWASHTNQHGAWTRTVGSQTIYDKEGLYNVMVGLYRRWGEEESLALLPQQGTLQWME